MIFLTPIPAIIAGAVAGPLLLLLYFLRLRRRPVRVGSTMLWAQAAEDLQANVPFKWLRPSLLLFLQLLILAALLLALARPAIRATGAMPAQVFLVIDRSASMRATDMAEGDTRFDTALRLARDAVERTAVGSFTGEITIVAFAANAEIVAGPTRSRAELLRALDSVTPSDEPGRVGEALRLIQALTTPDELEAEAPSRPLAIICSDGSGEFGNPAIGADVRFARAGPEGAAGENIGFVALAARRDAESPGMVRIFTRIASNRAEATTLGISVRLNDSVVERRAIEVEPAADGVPGQTPLSLAVDIPGGGMLSLTLEHRDALKTDDTVSMRIEPPGRPSVLLVRAAESEAAGAGWLLTDVLRELGLAELTLMSADRLAALGSEAYAGADLAIFDAAPAPGIPPIASVHFGLPPSMPGLLATPSEGAVRPVIAWSRSHPLMRDVALDAVRVGRTALLEPGETDAATEFEELARTAGGVVMAIVEEDGVPHVVCGFELVQSTWPIHYSFPIFLANALETLPRTGLAATGWFGVTGEPTSLPRPFGTDDARLLSPSGQSTPLSALGDAGQTTRLGMLETAGIWQLGAEAVPVNLLDERETSLESPTTLAIPGAEEVGRSQRAGAEEPREIWPWLLMAAAALLAAEWVLFGLRVRV